MKSQTVSIPTLLGFLALLLMVHTMTAAAAVPSIKCETAFGEKSFTIDDHHISFEKEDSSGVSRAISSVQGDSVRTQVKYKGFTKALYIDGNKYRINIKDAHSFSEVDDYLSITSPKGHEMTYPLTCHSV